MKKIFLLTITCLICSCEFNKTDIGTYPEINSIFNQEEIKDLRKILTFFNDAICKVENVENQAVEVCYQEFFKRMRKIEYTGDIVIPISKKEQDKLFEKIAPTTFEQIWQFTSVGTGNLHYFVPEMDLMCCKNKYANFLEKYGEINIKIQQYHDGLIHSGGISPGMFADVMINYKDYDVTDDRIKLIIAIHYLTQNERRKAYEILRSLDPRMPSVSPYLPHLIEYGDFGSI